MATVRVDLQNLGDDDEDDTDGDEDLGLADDLGNDLGEDTDKETDDALGKDGGCDVDWAVSSGREDWEGRTYEASIRKPAGRR